MGLKTRGRRIYILHSSSLLASGLEALLRGKGLAVTALDPRTPEARARLEMLKGRDIVIFDSMDEDVHPSLSLLHVLAHNPQITAIALNPAENKIEIYHKEQRPLAKTQDLLEALGSPPETAERRPRVEAAHHTRTSPSAPPEAAQSPPA